MTLDLRDLHLGRPHRRDRRSPAASARQFVLGDSEFVALAGADHELAFAAVGDLAGDGIVEEAVLEPVDDKPFEAVERLADLSAHWRAGTEVRFRSAIVQQCLHVLDGGGERERRNAAPSP